MTKIYSGRRPMALAHCYRSCSPETHAYVLLPSFGQTLVAEKVFKLVRVGRVLSVYMLSLAWVCYTVSITQRAPVAAPPTGRSLSPLL